MTAMSAAPRRYLKVDNSAGGWSSEVMPMPTVPTTEAATPAHALGSSFSPRRKWEKTARTATPPAATGCTRDTGAREMATTMRAVNKLLAVNCHDLVVEDTVLAHELLRLLL